MKYTWRTIMLILGLASLILLTSVGGVPELVTSEEMGVLVEPGDVDGLVRALHDALRRRWNRPEIAAQAGGRDWQSVGSVIGKELAALAERRGAAAADLRVSVPPW